MLDASTLPAPTTETGDSVHIPLLIAAFLGTASIADLAFVGRAAAQPVPLGQTDEWRLVFEDTFDGDALDPAKWVRCYWWDNNGCTNLGNKELQWYLPTNVSVADGALQLRAKPATIVRETATYHYSSGMVTTGPGVYEQTEPPKFEFQYGYAEIRARLPSGQGIWPAFWLLPTRHVGVPEIDVMEVLGQEPDKLHAALHYYDNLGRRRSRGHSIDTPDLSEDWHVYGVEWSPERIVWYFDGVEHWRQENPQRIPDEPMYLILNLAIGGIWAGPPDETTRFPADLAVDHVRVWQREQQ